jgi:hypothetical protein
MKETILMVAILAGSTWDANRSAAFIMSDYRYAELCEIVRTDYQWCETHDLNKTNVLHEYRIIFKIHHS